MSSPHTILWVDKDCYRSWLSGRFVILTALWITLMLRVADSASAQPDSPPAPPANDDFINAQSISGGSGVIVGTLVSATREPEEPLLNQSSTVSVWYRWTPPTNGSFYFTTASAAFGRVPDVELFTGTSVAALSVVPRDGSAWQVTTQIVYSIRVTRFSQVIGFSLAWDTEIAHGDFFRNSTRAVGWSGAIDGWSNRHATWEHGEPSANTGGRSIWFHWIAPRSGTATFDTVGSNFDTLLAAYRQLPRFSTPIPIGDIGNIELLDVSDDIIESIIPQSRVTFSVNAGGDYFLAVDGSGGATGDVKLNWSFQPDPARRADLIVSSEAMAPRISTFSNVATNDCIVKHGCLLPGTRRMLLFGTLTKNVGNADLYLAGISNLTYEYHPCHGHSHLEGFADYRLLTNGGAQVVSGLKASFCLEDGSRWDTNAIEVQRYTCNHQGIQAGWQDFYWDSLPCQWVDITDVPPGIYTLEIEVDPDNQLPELNETNNTARVQVTIPPVPFTHLNDSFETARDLGASTFAEREGDSRGATHEHGEPALGGGRSVWFRWIAPTNGPVTIETFSQRPTFDTVLGVYTGNSVSTLTQVAVNDDARPETKQSRVRFDAMEGTVYYVALDGAGDAEGAFRLRLWFGVPLYDDFRNASHYDSTRLLSSVNATKQSGEPDQAGNAGGRSVWFSYTAGPLPPVPTQITVTTERSGFDTLLAIYTGTTLTNLTEVASNDDVSTNRWSQVTFTAVPGTTYWIAVDGVDGDSGELRLGILRPDSIFSGIQWSGGEFRLDLFGDEEGRYVLEASTNLLNWSPVVTNSSLSGIGDYLFVVPAAANTPLRFFRAREIPDRDD